MPSTKSPEMSMLTHLDRKLPSVIESIRMDWIASTQSAAVVAAMLASVASQLLSTFSVPSITDFSGTQGALTVFSYCALLFSCSATISSLLLIDEFGELPIRTARLAKPVNEKAATNWTATQLLAKCGARPEWKLVMYHLLISLILGIISTILEIVLYVWLTLPLGIKIILLLVAIFSVLPLLFLVRLPQPLPPTPVMHTVITEEPRGGTLDSTTTY